MVDLVMPQAVAEAAERVRRDAADSMFHSTTADLSARLMCRVGARELGLLMAWLAQHQDPADHIATEGV